VPVQGEEADVTDHQRQALDKALALMKEHFDCAVIAYSAEVLGSDEQRVDYVYTGGYPQALGLMAHATDRLLASSRAKGDA
jgi:hypothetical protein